MIHPIASTTIAVLVLPDHAERVSARQVHDEPFTMQHNSSCARPCTMRHCTLGT